MTPKDEKFLKIVALIILVLILFVSIATYYEQVKHPYKNINCDQLSALTEERQCISKWMPQWIKDNIRLNQTGGQDG